VVQYRQIIVNKKVFSYVYLVVVGVSAVVMLLLPSLQQSKTHETQMLVEEFNHQCIVNYDLEGNAVKPEYYKDAGERARRAAAGIRDLEHDYFEIRSQCINHASREKQATVPMRYFVLDSSGWTRTKLLAATRQANAVFGQCGIHFDDIGVTVVSVDDRYRSVDRVEFAQLINATRDSLEATLYFLNEQGIKKKDLRGMAYTEGHSAWYEYYPDKMRNEMDIGRLTAPGILDNLALIVGNHTRKGQPDYQWRTLSLGKTVAHELYHILGNCNCHEQSNKKNFMYPGGRYDAIEITAEQCHKAYVGIRRLRSIENARIMTYDEP